MDEESKKIIVERFKMLPKGIQDAFLSANLPEKLVKITKKYNLRVDQAGALETEAHLVMLGIESSDSFSKNVQTEVGVSRDVAQQIATDVNTEVFLSIRDSLKQIQAENAEKESGKEETSATQATQEAKRSSLTTIQERDESIEETVPTNLPTGDISSLKLGGMFKVSKESKEEVAPIDETLKEQTPTNYETDPYRETIE